MRKTIFPVLIAVSQFVFITAKEPQKTTDEDHNCLLERWSDNDNIKIYNYIDFIVSDSDIVLLTKFKENKKDASKSTYQVIDTLRWSIEEGKKFKKKDKIVAKDIDGPCGRPVSLGTNGKMAILTLEQINTDNFRYKFNPVLVKDKSRKKLEKSNKQLKKFFKFVGGNGKVRYPDFDPKYTKLKESKPKDLATVINEEALDLTYTYRPTNKKDPILKCKKCLKPLIVMEGPIVSCKKQLIPNKKTKPMSPKGGKITFELSSYDSKCAEGSLIIQIGKQPAGPTAKAEPLMLPGPRGTIEDESARCKDGFEDITNIFRSREGAAKSCKTCKDNTGRCCYNSLTNSHVCECPKNRAGVDCGIYLGDTRKEDTIPTNDPMHATMSVILAAVIVFFLCLVVVVIYCTSEQRRKTKRKHAKRLSRDEGKRASNGERNNRENQLIAENTSRFKPDNQTTRNVTRYDGSNHERISLLNNTTENTSTVGASFLGPSRPSISSKPNNLSPSTFKQEAPRDRSPITPSIRSYNRQQEVTSDNEIKL